MEAVYGKGYWYIWAYIFVMLLSPIIDFFVENCHDRQKVINSFFFIGALFWGWSFFAQNVPQYIPTVKGFGDCSGVILLCVYIQTRLIKSLGWANWLGEHRKLLWGIFAFSAACVFLGLRHNNSIFAFAYAFSILILVNGIRLPDSIGRFFAFLAPSMFGVYLLHMPLGKYFPVWENFIGELIHLPRSLCQFLLACFVFIACIMVDLQRRGIVRLMKGSGFGKNIDSLHKVLTFLFIN